MSMPCSDFNSESKQIAPISDYYSMSKKIVLMQSGISNFVQTLKEKGVMMRGSRNFCQGGPGPTEKKQL